MLERSARCVISLFYKHNEDDSILWLDCYHFRAITLRPFRQEQVSRSFLDTASISVAPRVGKSATRVACWSPLREL